LFFVKSSPFTISALTELFNSLSFKLLFEESKDNPTPTPSPKFLCLFKGNSLINPKFKVLENLF
jgi:hypothetical protein